jgi:cytochrome P450 family 142 subfamily A polypeptide 1
MATNFIDKSKPLSELKLFDKEILECPYHHNQELRDKAPVYQDPDTGIYLVSKYELVKEAARKKDIFSNEFGLNSESNTHPPAVMAAMKRQANMGKGTLLTIDDPEHKKYRALVKDFFIPEKIAAYEEWILDFANKQIEKFADQGKCEFI